MYFKVTKKFYIGKTSLINSMNMALNQKWSDCAKYNPGRKHIIQECVLHTNKPDKQSQVS